MRNSTRKLERCHPQARIDRNLLTYKANAINLRKKPKSTKDSAISKWKSLQKLNFFGTITTVPSSDVVMWWYKLTKRSGHVSELICVLHHSQIKSVHIILKKGGCYYQGGLWT